MISPARNFNEHGYEPVHAAVVRRWKCVLVTSIALLGMLVMENAVALDIPALLVVQPEVAIAHPELVKQREAMLKERKALLDRTNSHNQSCHEVAEGSAEEKKCNSALALLMPDIDRHIQASKNYNDSLLSAANTAVVLKPKPAANSAVVDARNVPSGLPRPLDSAIAKAYANSPPGVIERVRKGFQAVLVGDWLVAKVWFQDALNRDSSNVGLKRLIILVDNSQQSDQLHDRADARNEPAGLAGKSTLSGTNATAGSSRNAPATPTDKNLQLPDVNDIYLMFPGPKARDDKAVLDMMFGLDAQSAPPEPGK